MSASTEDTAAPVVATSETAPSVGHGNVVTPSDPPLDAATPAEQEPEVVFYEGSGGAPAELILSLLLATTVLYIPLTLASIGRRAWLSYKFTNKRLIIRNTSPLFAREVQVAYSRIREVRSVSRAFGLWGDMVLFLDNKEQLELVGMEQHAELKEHIERCKWTLRV